MYTKTQTAVDFVISLILWILIGVFIVPLVLLLFLYKSFVIFLAKRVNKHLHPTQPNDTYFSMGDTKQVPIVNVAQIWRVDGVLDVAEFRALFQRLFLTCPESRKNYLNLYCYLQEFGGYIFKRSVEQIDLEKHIGVKELGGRTLEEFIVDYVVKEKFPEERPLWEVALVYQPAVKRGEVLKKNDDPVQLINNKLNNNEQQLALRDADAKDDAMETVVLLKMHHCLADGYGFIHMVGKLTGNEAPYLVEDEEESLSQKLKASFFGPKTLMDYVINVARTPDLFYPLKDRPNAQWYLGLNTLDLTKLKSVRRRTKTHFISVMMSLTIGAVRRYLVETAKSKNEEICIPSHIWTANSLPWPNHPRSTLVNHWSGGVFQVPFKTSDSLERLFGTEQFFRFFHDMQMHKTVKRLIIPATWCLPSALLRFGHSLDLYYFRYSNAFATLLLSEKPHYILGRRVKALYLPLAIKDAVTTSVLFGVSSSHSGQIDLSLLASSELVADQAALDKIVNVYFAQELDRLCRAAEGRVIPMEPPSPNDSQKLEKLPDPKLVVTDNNLTNVTGINMQKG